MNFGNGARMNPHHDTPLYPISSAAQMLGISVHTLRMYEREELIIPHKKESGRRLYSLKDIERMQCIRRALTEERMSIEAIKRILSLAPCWAIIHCPEADRHACPAYRGATIPCWSHKHHSNVCARIECRECEVYNDYADCHSIKTKLTELLP